MTISAFIGALLLAVPTLAQSNVNCDNPPASLQNIYPTQCCDIKFIIDEQAVKRCMSMHQGLSNVNAGVKGRLDGLECLFSCLLNSTNAVSNGAINVAALKSYTSQTLTKINQAMWIPTVNEAIDMCNSRTLADRVKISRSLNGKAVDGKNVCDPAPLYFGSCVYFHQIRKCPPEKQKNQTATLAACTELRNFYGKCSTPTLY